MTFENSKNAHFFKKSAAHFQKLMFTGTVNFDYRKFEKCAFFEKSPDHFQKLMFTGTVNFDYQKLVCYQASTWQRSLAYHAEVCS